MPKLILNAVCWLGWASIVYGVWSLSHPLGFIIGGAVAIVLSVMLYPQKSGKAVKR